MTIQANLKTSPKHSVRNGLMASCVAALGFAAPAYAGHMIVNFDPQGSASTFVTGINDSGTVAGYYGQTVDGLAMPRGYVRDAEGTITTFAPADAKATFAEAIDADGTIAGYYTDMSTGAERGFLRAAVTPGPNAMTAFDALYIPGTVVSTYAWSINAGEIAGSYTTDGATYHGYVREADGKVDRFDPSGSMSTYALSINNGAVAGYYFDGTTDHCFLRAANGAIVTFDPGASLDSKCYAIDARGWIAGYFTHTDGLGTLGFVRSPKNVFTVFNGRKDIGSTCAWGINAKAAVAGSWYDGKGEAHGLARNAARKIEMFDPYGSTATFAVSVNSKDSVAGYWTDGNGQNHGFIRVRAYTPQSQGTPAAGDAGTIKDPLLPRAEKE
jgi:hypothetical protein